MINRIIDFSVRHKLAVLSMIAVLYRRMVFDAHAASRCHS